MAASRSQYDSAATQMAASRSQYDSGSLSARMPLATESDLGLRFTMPAATESTLAVSDAEARVNALRLSIKNDIRSALSMSMPNSARTARPWDEIATPQLVLPPLRPPKEYAPTAASTGEQDALALAASGRHSPRNPPKISQLGSGGLPWADERSEQAAYQAFEEVAAVTTKRRLVWVKRQKAAEAAALHAEAMSPLQAEAQRGVLQRMRTVALNEGKGKIRGADPMAGSLFSRSARLDDMCQRKGIYEASLYEGSARVAANSGMGNVRPRG